VLQASLIGGAGVAALPLLALVGGSTREDEQPATFSYPLNTNWLFGGQYMAGSESSVYDDSNFAPITLPHTVTSLSWQNWDAAAWQQVWIYRRHFTGAQLTGPHRRGNRIFADFDGVMVNASVVINDQAVAAHQGGYLPWSAELTGKITSEDNLLAVIVDSRCLPVPPVGVGRGPGSIDFFQPGGIYRDVNLRVVPQAFLADLFALPADVLSPQPRVDVEAAIDAAVTPHDAGTLAVRLFDGTAQIAAQVAKVRVTSPGTSTAKLSLTDLGPISLWSPDSPKLYRLQATLSFPGLDSHVLTRQIGFREASFAPDGFYLNGERLQLFGLDRHQLYPYAGMAMPISPVAALPGRLRRARAAGLGGSTGLARRQHQPGLAGPRGAQRARHGDAGQEPSLGHHLGHPAQRDTRLPRAVGRDPAGRAGAGQLAAELGRDGPARGCRLERGCLRLQRLRHQSQDR
jgi:beta-galactosidase